MIGQENVRSEGLREQDSYLTMIENLWQISNEIESKLESVLTGSNVEEERPMPATKMLHDLDRLVSRFEDIRSRIVM